MTIVEQFLDALGSVESSNNPEAWGDHGRAMGRWQVHPDRLIDEARRRRVWPRPDETYDSWVRRILTAMYHEEITNRETPYSIAMYWHKGHWVDDGPDFDQVYADKFASAMSRAIGRAIS